tara:strand:+ start:78 stop:629 length:552 start_codon:yes stop_codon:yes gene_type:complete
LTVSDSYIRNQLGDDKDIYWDVVANMLRSLKYSRNKDFMLNEEEEVVFAEEFCEAFKGAKSWWGIGGFNGREDLTKDLDSIKNHMKQAVAARDSTIRAQKLGQGLGRFLGFLRAGLMKTVLGVHIQREPQYTALVLETVIDLKNALTSLGIKTSALRDYIFHRRMIPPADKAGKLLGKIQAKL